MRMLRYVLCEAFFILGDAVSKVLNRLPDDERPLTLLATRVTYWLYNKLMLASVNLDRGDLGLWTTVKYEAE